MLKNLNPRVTYVIPTYNHSQFILPAIESIIDQTYQNIELLIINDGSTDNTEEIVSKIFTKCENRFTRFKFISRENKGLVKSLNEGLNWAEGEYFCMLASDDILLPAKTEIMIDLISNAHPDIVACFAAMKIIDSDSKCIGKHSPKAGIYDFSDIIMKRAPYSAPTQIIRTSELRLVGGYDENLKFEDWAILLALTQEGKKIQVSNQVVSLYRRHSDNISKQVRENHSYRLQVLKKYADHYLYRKATARVLAGHASEIADISSRDACITLYRAWKKNWTIIFDKKFRRGTNDMTISFIKLAITKILQK